MVILQVSYLGTDLQSSSEDVLISVGKYIFGWSLVSYHDALTRKLECEYAHMTGEKGLWHINKRLLWKPAPPPLPYYCEQSSENSLLSSCFHYINSMHVSVLNVEAFLL